MNLINEKMIDEYVKKFNFKQMLILPVILLIVSLSILAYTSYTTRTPEGLGAPVKLGMEFQGGTAITFDSSKTPEQLKEEFSAYPVVQAREYGGGNQKLLQFGPMTESQITDVINKINSEYSNPGQITQMGEVVSKSLQRQTLNAILFSFIGMAIVVFIVFRIFVPSVAVVISAFADIAFAAAMMDVFGIVLSLGTVAALLMLIGYSVDTDILLTTRLLKRKGELSDKIKDAMKTGMTMTLTTLAALIALFVVSSGSYLVSSFTRIDIIRDISVVLIFGLIADIVNTWMTNVGILKWYLEKTGKTETRVEKPKEEEAGSMNGEEPFYKKPRVLLLFIVILASIVAMTVSYKNGEVKVGSNLNYGLDLQGGSWLQLQLQGAIVQVSADENKIIQSEFQRLLNDPSVKVEETTLNSVTFTTAKQTTQKIIDSFGFGKSTITQAPDGGTRISLQISREYAIQKYLENNLNAEIRMIPGNVLTFEIRKAVTQDELNAVLKPVDGKVNSFKVGVSSETRDETKKILETKLNSLGMKEIPIRTVGDDFILIDLAGVDITTAKDIAAKPGKFEIRIQVNGNVTEHVLYGTEITPGLPEKQTSDVWAVTFTLSDAGAAALRDAAIQYGAVTNPSAHELIMLLDENEVYSAPLSPELARNIQSVPVKSLSATTGAGDEGQRKANELQIHLRAGALPVKVDVIGAGEVSAELGSRFKSQVLIAGLIALILVAIVVSLRYKQPNIVIPMLSTSFSEVIIILGFTVLVGFQLDLPTIAGIIAVIGTGIDHLIIITDEVLAGGAMPPDKVYRSRLTKAFAIIFSAAATVLVAMSPLLIMGFGALRGFAVITIVGVLIGVFIARPAYAEVIQGMLVEDTGKKFVDE